MKLLPYFKWYPSDAEGDDFYSLTLSNEELGIYHRLLNRAWLNDGITSDLKVLAVFCRLSNERFDEVWKKLSKRWIVSPRDESKLVNPRQEEERESAKTKSENNKREGNANAKGSRSKREPNGSLRAYESVSESLVEGSSKNEEEEKPVVIRSTPEWKTEESFTLFVGLYRQTGGAFIDDDFAQAFQWSWKPLDWEQKAQRVKAIKDRLALGAWEHPRFVPKPRKFIETEWGRPILPRASPNKPQFDGPEGTDGYEVFS